MKISQFNFFILTFISQQNQTNENLNPVLRCICNCLRVVIFTTSSDKEPFKRFISYLPNEVDLKQ
jgi:hypothetical protein